jgi:IS30 family transposase
MKKQANDQLTERQKFLLKHEKTIYEILDAFLTKETNPIYIFHTESETNKYYKVASSVYFTLDKKDIPEGFKYAAVNRDGNAYAYKKKPFLNKYEWDNNDTSIEGRRWIAMRNAGNWKNSLISIDNEKTN